MTDTQTPTYDKAVDNTELFEYFRSHGYVVLENALTPNEVAHYLGIFDQD